MTYIFETDRAKVHVEFDEYEEAESHALLLNHSLETNVKFYPANDPENITEIIYD
jgi:hypothetical protein